MFKSTRNVYTIKTSPYNDNEKLEALLNEMSQDGWDLYSMQELETDGDVVYNCIFIKEIDNNDGIVDDDGLLDFRPRIERIINTELDPYEMCLDILKKIKDKRQKISQVKTLIDNTSEDSRTVLNEEISRHISELDNLKKKLSRVVNPDIMQQKIGVSRLTLILSEELIDILDSGSEENLLSQIVYVRQRLTERLGYILPKIKIEIDDSLDENEFQIKVRGVKVLSSTAYCKYTMFLEKELNPDNKEDDVVNSKDALTGQNSIWISDEKAKDYWVKGLSVSEYIGSLIEHIVIKNIDIIFDYSDINRYIEIVGNQNLYLIENIIPDFISVSELKSLLINLVREKVSIKDIVYIFEKLNDLSDTEEKEDVNLLDDIRNALSKQICASISSEDNIIKAYELSAETIETFALKEERGRLTKSATDKLEKTIFNLKNNLTRIASETNEIVLIVPSSLRKIIYIILSEIVHNLTVISEEELDFDYEVEILGEL